MKPKQIPGVPAQKSGGFHDTESKKQYKATEINAKFEILKKRLFSINEWKDYCGKASSEFKHFSESGQPVNRTPQRGDFIRIGIPSPGTKEANGYDWVEITNIAHRQIDNYESYLITCKPSKDPNQPKGRIAHFYRISATSNIMIAKEGDLLKAGVYGRNEKPNFNAGLLDKIRNFMIAIGGMIGIAKIQWKLLTDGLLDF
ncbi:hypothetical protein SAMN05421856_102541 [Chryseobacterium taichungense]|uniref:Uncharacterized protein n=1 Tax=Chryseobacterium taichungense TaxID=295069 RepID=A0A1H7XMR7_9FLAO|nr:hypothetical protein [Chryseobacterium taichungense]SEM34933.1 hypothetical protein SAMN05421856_102541 [Chryseobacterium taichungense]